MFGKQIQDVGHELSVASRSSLVSRCCNHHISYSVTVLAGTSVRSTRKLLSFIMRRRKKNGQSIPKTVYLILKTTSLIG